MESDSGRESIPELIKSLESTFFPSDYKVVEEKLLAREEQLNLKVETYKKKCEALKLKLEEIRTPKDVLNGFSNKLLRNENNRLKEKIDRLEDENAAYRRDYEELVKRMSQIEDDITEMKADFGSEQGCPNGVVMQGETGNSSVHSKLKMKWPICFEEFLFITPSMASKSPPSEEGDLNGSKLGSKKVNKSYNSLQTNGEKTTAGLKRRESSLVDLSDDESENSWRKLRKTEACCVVGEAARSSSKSLQDMVVLEKCQETSNTKMNSYDKNTMASSTERDSFQRQHNPEVKN
ncbi:hypothetical protein CDL15_Pgr028039 [Punica granatum]|uniref:Uncharacterized protein n=1 Tax=Punica granatum TaxID=22663 RepID=A0A218XLQ5_PUNGR|nr:hypothetical protein CDL15_Pgr028039 [Punica granatum]